jgi:thiosulfate dehydrogenase [quinone] large subunit
MLDQMQSRPSPQLAVFLFASKKMAWLWLLLRVYVGWEWLVAGYNKLISSAWVGEHAGTAITGFLTQALQKTAGAHPDVSSWYAWFISTIALPNATLFSYVVTFGELLVGVGLILGVFTTFAALGGIFMNLNYLFAGTVSINPLLLIVQILLVQAWRVSGWYGGDYVLSKYLNKAARQGRK